MKNNGALKDLRVLIVEDDDDYAFLIRDYINEVLKRKVLYIEHAHTYAEALEKIEAVDYDLFIFDYLLNHINGIELIEEVKKRGLKAPIIFLTGYGNEEIAVNALKAGATDYIQKAKLTPEVLKRSMYHCIKLTKEENRRKQAEEELLEKNTLLEEINKNLEQKVKEAVAKNREKDYMLIQQSRLAAMGEMIGHIAHQWRQPLNLVGLIIQDMKDAYKHGELTEEYIGENVSKGMDVIHLMSQTIDDFRNFFKPDKIKQEFSVKDIIEKSLSFVIPGFKNCSIGLEAEIKNNVSITGYPNEYCQVLLNILGNAKDISLERNVKNPLVKITAYADNGRSVVLISDNGGGIEESIIDRIFEPYFTTRKENGTGIGLYMSKMIIEKNMGGSLTVRNINSGAEFKIIV